MAGQEAKKEILVKMELRVERGSVMRKMLVLFLVMAGSAMAGLIVTANPSTSATWPVGSSFETGEVAATTDPVGPFSGTAVEFRGYAQGGSTVPIPGGTCPPCLVFSYALTFSAPTAISSISFTGDAFNTATFELLNSSASVIDSLSENSGNVGSPVTYTMLTPGASGTSFTLVLYDASSWWTYVSNISVSSVPVTPEPATYTLVLVGLGAVVWARRGRLHRQKRP